jgi:molybdopterin-guanine dinucleotide biosynthesis protein A
MTVETEPLTAYVLAGGKSSRMGTDKAFLELAGRPLIAHAVELAGSVTGNVRIVGDPEKFAAFGMIVPDVYKDGGPLGGIHAALLNSSTDANFVLGVDLPFIDRAFLAFLISIAHCRDAVVTVPSCGSHFQTLCAVYHRPFGEIADRALASGHNKIDALFSDVPVRVIDEEEIKSAGFSPSMFRNLNTPAEWEAGKRDFELRRARL